MAHGALDLRAQQRGIVAEVALEGVLVDHDPVRVVVAGDRVAHVHAVGVVLAAAVRDDDRRLGEGGAEFFREFVECLHYEVIELGRRQVGRRAAGEGLAPLLEPAELLVRHLLAGQRGDHPREN